MGAMVFSLKEVNLRSWVRQFGIIKRLPRCCCLQVLVMASGSACVPGLGWRAWGSDPAWGDGGHWIQHPGLRGAVWGVRGHRQVRSTAAWLMALINLLPLPLVYFFHLFLLFLRFLFFCWPVMPLITFYTLLQWCDLYLFLIFFFWLVTLWIASWIVLLFYAFQCITNNVWDECTYRENEL